MKRNVKWNIEFEFKVNHLQSEPILIIYLCVTYLEYKVCHKIHSHILHQKEYIKKEGALNQTRGRIFSLFNLKLMH